MRALAACVPTRGAAGERQACACHTPSWTPQCFGRSPLASRRRRSRAPFRPAAAAGGGAGDSFDEQLGGSSSIPDALPVAGVDSDWRAFRAKLVAATAASEAAPGAGAAAPAAASGAWAHAVPHPEQGCLLLANPLMFQSSQTYFYLSVILVVENSEGGSIGFILNRPMEYTIGQLEAGVSQLQPELNDCRLYLGGDVDPGAISLLHGVPGLASSREVLAGVHMGGLEDAKRGLAEGRFSPDEFKVLHRYAGWRGGQLEAECRQGVWFPVSASGCAILNPPASAQRRVEGMWHYIAQLAGGDLAKLSREVQGVADPEIAKAAAGGYRQQKEEQQEQQEAEAEGDAEQDGEDGEGSGNESGGGSGSSGGGGSQWQQRRRSKLLESDYSDGAGI